jgi:uncharacterized protein YcaQ
LEKLSIKQARKIALHAQQVLAVEKTGRAIDVTRSVIQNLGYIQIDTISVIQRAHHHTLWNRNPRYRPAQLDRLQQQGQVFEYWSHAAAYLPMEDYRMCLPNMRSIKRGDQLWYRANPEIKKQVLARIRDEGPLQSRDFENHGRTRLPMWEWKPAKQALESLFMEGELMVVRRQKFQKVYDLRERVLEDSVNTSFPDRQEFAEFLVNRYLDAHGIGTAAEITYLRKGMKKDIESRMSTLEEEGQLVRVAIGDSTYFATPNSLELLTRPLARSRLRILSPFDNLVIQRKRIGHLFGFDYQIECYVPEKKRRYGYFCLPILWNAELVARMDCKAVRKTGMLEVHNLVIESAIKDFDAFLAALVKELLRFMVFNGCGDIRLKKVSDAKLEPEISRRIGILINA